MGGGTSGAWGLRCSKPPTARRVRRIAEMAGLGLANPSLLIDTIRLNRLASPGLGPAGPQHMRCSSSLPVSFSATLESYSLVSVSMDLLRRTSEAPSPPPRLELYLDRLPPPPNARFEAYVDLGLVRSRREGEPAHKGNAEHRGMLPGSGCWGGSSCVCRRQGWKRSRSMRGGWPGRVRSQRLLCSAACLRLHRTVRC